jgi:hypothetical protein
VQGKPIQGPARRLREDEHLLDLLILRDDHEEVDVDTIFSHGPGSLASFLDQGGLSEASHVRRMNDLGVLGVELAVHAHLHVGWISWSSSPVGHEVALPAHKEVVELLVGDVQGIRVDLLIVYRPCTLDKCKHLWLA